MGKIFVLAGKTMAGKSTVADILENEHDIIRVRSFTTRPKRENEIDEVDYYFYDNDTVLLLIVLGKVVAARAYQPHESFGSLPWYYGFNIRDITSVDNPLLITDLEGIKNIKEKFGEENVVVFYLDVTKNEQDKRIESRGSVLNEEQQRRISADNKDFIGIEDHVDHIISASKKPNLIAKEIAKVIATHT